MNNQVRLVDTYDTLTDTYIFENLSIPDTAKRLFLTKNVVDGAWRNDRLVKRRYQIEETSNIQYSETEDIAERWDKARFKLNPKARGKDMKLKKGK